MTYKSVPPYNIESKYDKFDFKKMFTSKQWHRVPYHAKNMIINLGHLINRKYFHKSYVTNKNEPRRLADIFAEQNNYFSYVLQHLIKHRKYEKDKGIKNAYTKLINLISGKKKEIVKHNVKKKKVKEGFISSSLGNNKFLLVLAIVVMIACSQYSKK